MKILPTADNVLVRRFPEEATSAGGLHLPTRAVKLQCRGEVLAVGPGKPTGEVIDNWTNTDPPMVSREQIRVPMQVQPGDVVLFTKYAGGGRELEVDGQPCLMLEESEIIGVLEEGLANPGEIAQFGPAPLYTVTDDNDGELYRVVLGSYAGGAHPDDQGDGLPAELRLSREDPDGKGVTARYVRHPDVDEWGPLEYPGDGVVKTTVEITHEGQRYAIARSLPIAELANPTVMHVLGKMGLASLRAALGPHEYSRIDEGDA